MKSFSAQQRLDSRGKPTVQVQLVCTHGTFRAIVPSGATKGDYESVELRDDDPKAYNGQGVSKAISNVNHILGPAIIKQNFDLTRDQRRIDEYMIQLDGSDDKHNLGANAILGISMAVARAAAAAKGVPLYEFLAEVSGRRSPGDKWSMPIPFMNVLNGGGHSGNALAFQEFMIAPFGAEFFAQAVQWNAETYVALKKLIEEKHGKAAIGLGDEGGFAPPCKHPKEALDLLVAAIKAAGHEGKIKIGVDAAAESFRTKDGMYDMGYKAAEQELIDTHDMTELYQELLTKFPILLLEDPFGQDDWAAFAELTKQCKVELVGDDLLATNMKRINTAEEKKACNSLLLKINQIGTISEAIDA